MDGFSSVQHLQKVCDVTSMIYFPHISLTIGTRTRLRQLAFGECGEHLWNMLCKQDFKEVHYYVDDRASSYHNYARNYMVHTFANPRWERVTAENGDSTAVERQVLRFLLPSFKHEIIALLSPHLYDSSGRRLRRLQERVCSLPWSDIHA